MIYDRAEYKERPDTTSGEFIFPWRATCESAVVVASGRTCEFREVFYTHDAASHAAMSHQHLIYPLRRYSFLSIAEYYWIELDRVVDQIMDQANTELGEALYKAKGRAAGLAFAIVKACTPHYADEQAVSRESLRRYKMRQGQLVWEPTPGFKYDPPIPGAQNQYSAPDAPTPTYGKSELDRVISKLGTAKVGQIKQGISGGMFTPKDFAKVFGITEEQVSAIAKS